MKSAGLELVQVRIRETNESEPFEDASLVLASVVKTRTGFLPGISPP